MIYRFNEFRLNPGRKLFYRGDELLEIEQRVFDFLLLLLERYPETVTRRELLESLWPRQEITDWALSQLIRRTRQLLADDSRAPTYIKTIHGVGVRFLVEPEQLPEEEPAVQKAEVIREPGRRRILVVASLLGAGLLMAYFSFRPISPPGPDPDGYPYRVAVLPFEYGTPDGALAWVRLGLMDMVRQVLDESAGIQTVETRKVIAYLDDRGDVSPQDLKDTFDALCGDLGCQVLLRARLEKALPQPRIQYQIVTSRGVSAPQNIDGGTIMVVASRLADNVIRQVDPAQPWLVSTRDTYSTNDAANQAYALGSQELFNGDYASAIPFLNIALDKVPDFAWAKARLAEAEYRKGDLATAWELTGELLDDQELSPPLRYQVLRVVSNIQYTRGELKQSRETSLQLRELARASGNLVAEAGETLNIGTSYQAAGDTEQALGYLLQARDLYRRSGYRPGLGMSLFNIGNIHMAMNDYRQAEDFYEQAELEFLRLGNHQRVVMARFQRAVIFKARGELVKAENLFRELLPLFEALEDGEGVALTRIELAGVHILDGRYELAVGEIRDFLPGIRQQGFSYAVFMAKNLLALAYLNLHQPDQARDNIQADSEFGIVDPYYALLPAHLAYEERRFEDAVALARETRDKVGDAWLPRHDAFLRAYEMALADGKWREITF